MAGETTNNTQKPYSVLKIDEQSRIGEMNNIETYYRHTIRTRGGTILHINISEQDFTADKATPILTKKAQEADKILQS